MRGQGREEKKDRRSGGEKEGERSMGRRKDQNKIRGG